MTEPSRWWLENKAEKQDFLNYIDELKKEIRKLNEKNRTLQDRLGRINELAVDSLR